MDEKLEERLNGRINRIARGLDLPVEVIMGHMSTTFANAASISTTNSDITFKSTVDGAFGLTTKTGAGNTTDFQGGGLLLNGATATIDRSTISDNVALADQIAHTHYGALVDVGVLIRAGVFGQVVDIDADFSRNRFSIIDPNHNSVGIDIIDNTTTQRLYRRT